MESNEVAVSKRGSRAGGVFFRDSKKLGQAGLLDSMPTFRSATTATWCLTFIAGECARASEIEVVETLTRDSKSCSAAGLAVL